MRKIIKITTWNPNESFTSANVLDESHWFVKGLKRALTLLDIGNFSISYTSSTTITLQTGFYGSIVLQRPTSGHSDPYIFYVNSVDKELWGGSALTQTYNTTSGKTPGSSSNFIRGPVRHSTSGSSHGGLNIAGGILQLKFEDGTIKGCSSSLYMYYMYGTNYIPSHIGVVLPENYTAQPTPISSVTVKYTRMPIVNKTGEASSIMSFEGEYFRSIFLTQQYYLGALKSSDNTKFLYDGYLFLVDDARDIEEV